MIYPKQFLSCPSQSTMKLLHSCPDLHNQFNHMLWLNVLPNQHKDILIWSVQSIMVLLMSTLNALHIRPCQDIYFYCHRTQSYLQYPISIMSQYLLQWHITNCFQFNLNIMSKFLLMKSCPTFCSVLLQHMPKPIKNQFKSMVLIPNANIAHMMFKSMLTCSAPTQI